MANNRIQFKRTSTTGLLPNTTNSANASYIAAGEFAVNLTDKRVIASDGSATFEVGGNVVNRYTTGNLTMATNGTKINFTANASAAGNLSSFTLQTDNNFVFYNTATDGSQRAIWANFTNSNTSSFQVLVPFKVSTALQDASGSNGLNGYVLTSNGTAVNWAAASGGGGSVNTAAQYTWTNTQTFSMNVSFSDAIGVANGKAVYLSGLADNNWKLGRNIATYTKAYYTNNSMDFLIGSSSLEGITFGNIANTSFLEMGSAGNWFRANVAIGNVAWNSMLTVNGTVTFANSTANTLNIYANGQILAPVFTGNVTGTASNASALSSVTLATIQSQITGNAATAYSNAVANAAALYQTTAGLSANVLTLTSNNSTNFGGLSLATLQGQITGNAATAYTNAVNYVANGVSNGGIVALTALNANNATNLGGTAAASYATYSGTTPFTGVQTFNANANFGNATSNATIFSNGVGVYFTGASYVANNANYLGGTTLATLQSQITGNAATAYSNAVANASALYQTTAGLASNVATLTANNTTYVNGKTEANLNVNSATNATNANNSSYLGGVAAASYVNTSGAYTISGVHNYSANVTLVGNSTAYLTIGNSTVNFAANSTTLFVGNSTVYTIVNSTAFSGTANNATNLGGTAASGYQTTAGLSANVATLTANNSTYLGGYTWASPGAIGSSTANTGAFTSLTSANVTTTTNTATFGSSGYFVANGNFGLGTGSPASKLQVVAPATTHSIISQVSSNTYSVFQGYSSSGASTTFIDGIGNIYFGGILYDNSNSSYYLKPSSTSVLNAATFNANIAMSNNSIVSPTFQAYKENVNATTISTTTQTLDLSLTNIYNLTLANASITLTFSNPPASGTAYSFMLYCKQDATGSRAITWPATVKWPNGSSPTLSTGANKIDVLNFFTLDGGTTYLGALSLANTG